MVDYLIAVDSQKEKTVYVYASGIVAEVTEDSISVHYPPSPEDSAPSMFHRA